jgi:hypothetical protein
MARLRKLGATALLGVAAFGVLTIVSSTSFAGKTDPIPPNCPCEPAIKIGNSVCVLATCTKVGPKDFVCTYACPHT